jgi:hypothetical protein
MLERAQQEYPEDDISWSRPPYFGQRTRYAKEVYAHMTEAEKEDVQQQLQSIRDKGWDPETQKMYVPLLPKSVPNRPHLSRFHMFTHH